MQESQQGRNGVKAPLRGRPYSCDACPKQFETPSKLARHYLTHTGQKPFPCQDCGKSFRQMVHLERHTMTHALPFRCAICQRHFKDAERFHKHQQLHARRAHIKIRPPKKPRKRSVAPPLYCFGCQRTFDSEEKQLLHQCDVINVTKDGKAGTLLCILCHKAFPSRSKLERHIMIHTGQKPFVCTLCGKAFRQKVHLRIHHLTHTQEKPFQCHQCFKTFKTMNQLLRHEVVHIAMLSVHCSVGVSSTESFVVKKEPDEVCYVIPFQCPTCDKGFASQEILDSHGCLETQAHVAVTMSEKTSVKKKRNCEHYVTPTSVIPPGISSVTGVSVKAEHLEEAVASRSGTMPYQQLGIPRNVLQWHPQQTWKPPRRRFRTSQLLLGKFFQNQHFTINSMSNGPIETPDSTFCPEEHGEVRDTLFYYLQQPLDTLATRRFQVRRCDRCDKTFPSLSKLRRHYLIHTGQKPFSCTECGRNFRQSVHLKRHQMTHMEKVLYRPQLATEDYYPTFDQHQENTRYLLQQHSIKPIDNIQERNEIGFVDPKIKVKLEAADLPEVAKKPVVNKRAQMTLSKVHNGKCTQDRSLKKRRTRAIPRNYKCNVCNKNFLSPSKLARHYLVHSGQKPFECPECGKSFRQDPHLKRHMITHIKVIK